MALIHNLPVQKDANRLRGAVLNTFVALEHLLSDITIHTAYKGSYQEYYKVYRPTQSIISDFIKCLPLIENIAGKYFTDAQDIEADLKELASIRHRIAHGQFLGMEIREGKSLFFFYTMKKSKEDCCCLDQAAAFLFQQSCAEFVGRLSHMQSEIYHSLQVPFPSSLDESLILNAQEIKVRSSWVSIKSSP